MVNKLICIHIRNANKIAGECVCGHAHVRIHTHRHFRIWMLCGKSVISHLIFTWNIHMFHVKNILFPTAVIIATVAVSMLPLMFICMSISSFHVFICTFAHSPISLAPNMSLLLLLFLLMMMFPLGHIFFFFPIVFPSWLYQMIFLPPSIVTTCIQLLLWFL